MFSPGNILRIVFFQSIWGTRLHGLVPTTSSYINPLKRSQVWTVNGSVCVVSSTYRTNRGEEGFFASERFGENEVRTK